ncbi:hypothetical protein F66182_3382 [Fusarium sp. NRRL 66182]|nr:hypothetical protein F66182_3382 [Fusarium sp. NRRL 66182]
MTATDASQSPLETRLFINGQYVSAKTDARLTCYNAQDNSEVSSDVHVAKQADVDAAVEAARAAYPLWSSTPPMERALKLLKLADLIDANADELVRLESLCSAKPLEESKKFEVTLTANIFRYYAGWCDKLEGETLPADNGFLKIVRREPIGVCAAVNAFNGPVPMVAMKGAPCLAAGNTMVMKASEKSPLSTLFFGKLFQEAGFPPGVFNLISGAGETGAFLSSHVGIDKISFTGSVNTGKKIAQMAAASNLKRVTLELGGKSPSIVFSDANLDVAVEWCTRGIILNSGQACIASSRVYVHRDIKEEFIKRMKHSFENTHGLFGDPSKSTTKIGPLVDKTQFERGCWIKPTIFVDPKPDARIYKEEIFGPVVVITDFTDEDDVIARANDTQFGLSGAVFSQDINRALRVSSKIHSGTVCVNCCTMIDYVAPFGGFKSSGWGRELGKYGIHAYTEAKTVFVKRLESWTVDERVKYFDQQDVVEL